MFDMGFWEMALIFIILLVVVGPDRLPGVIRTVGLWVGKARRVVSSVRHEIEQELRVSEIRRSIDQEVKSSEFQHLADQVKSINDDLDRTDAGIRRETAGIGKESEKASSSKAIDNEVKQAPPASVETTPGENRG